MKILIVAHYFKPHIGGIEIIAYNQAKELVEKGHQVTIITSKFQHEKTLEHSEGIRIVRVAAWNVSEDTFHVPYPLFSLRLISVIHREVRDHDIIHAHGALYLGSVWGAIYAKMHKKPFFLTEHVGFVTYNHPIINLAEKLAFYTLGLYTLRASNATIVYNYHVSALMRQYKKEVLYLSNGVDFKLFHPPTELERQTIRERYHLPQDTFIVLFVGRFVPKKGFDVLYKAKDPAYMLVFVGGGSIPAYIQSDNCVKIIEPLPQAELALLYKASDAFILPSYGEGFPLAIQEAMATGLPIITSKHNNLDQIVDSPLISYIDITEEAIKSAINEIQSNHALQKEMSAYSSATAREHYSWERMTTKLVELYAQGITQSATPKGGTALTRAKHTVPTPPLAERGSEPAIIQITSYYPPHLGGMENVAAQIAERFIDKGYALAVYTSDIGYSWQTVLDTKVPVHYLKAIEFAHTPIMFSLFFRLLTLPRHTLIHLHIAQAFSPEVVYLISKIKKIPYIAHIHLDVNPSGPLGFLLETYKGLLLKRVLRSAAKIICLTESQRQFIAAKYALPLTSLVVIPNGVAETYFIEKNSSENTIPHLLFVGRLVVQKNLALLIEALSYMQTNVFLDIVGEGELRKNIEDLIQKYELKNVKLHGKKTGADLIELYKSADIFVLPSLKEGVSLSMLEALAAGLPVVASDAPEIRGILGACGILIQDPTATNYARALDEILSNKNSMQTLSALSVQKARAYSWTSALDAIEDVYKEVTTSFEYI